MKDFIKQFEDLLDKDMNLVKAQIPPNEKEINNIEKSIGHTFLPEYKDFLKEYGSIYLMAKENVWPRPKEYDVIPLWKFVYAIMVFGLPSNAEKKVFPDWLNIERIFHSFNKKNKIKSLKYFVPFFKWQGLADYVGFGPDNKLYSWYSDNPGFVEPLDQKFYDFVINETKRLMKDKGKIKGDISKNNL